MIDEKIHIVKYDSEWPILFEKEKQKVHSALSDLVIDIQHFGSTAVKGMAAKPIIDILVGLKSFNLSEKHIKNLTKIGYEDLGEAGIPGRLYFRKRHLNAYII
jgi:GrpB-like predicted nucleotidyltransferase (UPF0157 family)